jgi:hypothetical protein
MHGSGKPLDHDSLAALVAELRASVEKRTLESMEVLVSSLQAPITTLVVRE